MQLQDRLVYLRTIRLRRAKWDISIWWLTSSFYIGICDWDVLTERARTSPYFRLHLYQAGYVSKFVYKKVSVRSADYARYVHARSFNRRAFRPIRLTTSNFTPFRFHHARVCEVNKSLLRFSLIKSTVWYKSGYVSNRDSFARCPSKFKLNIFHLNFCKWFPAVIRGWRLIFSL